MTREEAIKELEILKEDYWDDDGYGHETKQYDNTMLALDMAIKALEQEPTTKNDLAQERYQDLIDYFGDKETAKTILEDKKEFKAWLERLRWNVKRVDELARELEQLKETTKNDLGVDCISRADVKRAITDVLQSDNCDYDLRDFLDDLVDIPSVTPQKCKVGRWIFVEGIKGKDNVEKCSCCGSHWKEAIIYRTDTQEYLRTRLLYCPNCGADMREV